MYLITSRTNLNLFYFVTIITIMGKINTQCDSENVFFLKVIFDLSSCKFFFSFFIF